MSKLKLLLALLKESVGNCYLYDYTLIERGMEQASVARIFFYMQESLKYDNRFTELAHYNLDSEYNKNGQAPKRTPRFENGTRPDIILHHRKNEPCIDNCLILEFKSASNDRYDEIQKDKEKLEDFTNIECGYFYFIGVFVKLNILEPQYTFFQNGNEVQEVDLHE